MFPLHLASKWFHCTIMQHQGLGVHKVIKRFSNYYWSHVKGSMQISGRTEAVGVFSLLSRKQSIFSGGWRPNTDTEKKRKKQVSIENSYLTLKWENFENSLWHNRHCLPMIFFFFLSSPYFIFDFPERCLSYHLSTGVGAYQILGCKTSQPAEETWFHGFHGTFSFINH